MSAGQNGAGDGIHFDTAPIVRSVSVIDHLEPVPLSPIHSQSDGSGSGVHEKHGPNDSPRSGSDPELEKGRESLGEQDEEEKRRLLYKVEKVELTPMEAFKWNVEGDQSPCRWTPRLGGGMTDAPVPEVAACVPNTDDPAIPCNSESARTEHVR